MRRDWKSVQPNSLIDALRLGKDYARDKHRLSVERIAELMGIEASLLYKWLANGRMPASLIPAYEHICRCSFVSRWLAASSGHLLIAMPTGRTASGIDMNDLQSSLNTAVGELLHFYAGGADPETVLAAVRTGMEGLAWHHGNVQQADSPQLELGATA